MVVMAVGLGGKAGWGGRGWRALAGKILTTEYTEHTEREKERDLTARIAKNARNASIFSENLEFC